MGIKKKFFYTIASDSFRKILQKPGLAKKAFIAVLSAAIVFMVMAGTLLYFAVSMIGGMLSEKPDIDLIALERLIAERAILLTEEQKSKMMPIIDRLADPEISEEQETALKAQLWRNLDAPQLQMLEEWKKANFKKAEKLFTIPPGLAAFLEKYTGITTEMVRERIEAFKAWWRTKKPENSADRLRETMEHI